ncbi:MAG: hypothetical protein ACJAWV_003157 [Flammeovirgaceae bacterium]|jgi:hypothetical protein
MNLRIMKNSFAKSILFLLLSFTLFAFSPQQDSTNVKSNGKQKITERDYNNAEIEMADAWRDNGKIYVVVATIASIVGGIIFYLIILDRKVGKLEKQMEED